MVCQRKIGIPLGKEGAVVCAVCGPLLQKGGSGLCPKQVAFVH